jgi:hypothetical protein
MRLYYLKRSGFLIKKVVILESGMEILSILLIGNQMGLKYKALLTLSLVR